MLNTIRTIRAALLTAVALAVWPLAGAASDPLGAESLASIADDPMKIETLAGFKAQYEARYAAFKADVWINLSQSDTPGEYSYEVVTKARGLARLVRSGTGVEQSRFELTAGGPRSIEYRLDDGTEKVENDTVIDFDWNAGVAHSIYKDEAKDLELSAGTLDRLTADIAAIRKLRMGLEPGSYELVHRNSLRTYAFTPQGKEIITVPAGEFATVKYLYQRPGSSRSALIWYAPELDYVPVKVEQFKRGKAQIEMVAISVQNDDGEIATAAP